MAAFSRVSIFGHWQNFEMDKFIMGYVVPEGYKKIEGRSCVDSYGVRMYNVANKNVKKFVCMHPQCRLEKRTVSIKGSTKGALDHLRNVHNISIETQEKKRKEVSALLPDVDVAIGLNARQSRLLLTLDLLGSMSSFNSANMATKTLLCQVLTRDSKVTFHDYMTRSIVVEIYTTHVFALQRELKKNAIGNVRFVSFNIDELHEQVTKTKYTGIRIYFVTKEFQFRSHLVRFSKTYPKNTKTGTSTNYIRWHMEAVQRQLGLKFCSGSTDSGSDVKKAVSGGEYGVWFWCVNHMVSRAMLAAWAKGTLKNDITSTIVVCVLFALSLK
jgi:hypothetical protein